MTGRLVIRRHQATGVSSEAVFSACGAYRYALTRRWDPVLPRLTWVMLNPSTADERQNDPTIARCERRARAMGYGAYRIVNLYAFRSTLPRDLRAAGYPVGPGNAAALKAASGWAARIICAWGGDAPPARAAEVVALLRDAGAELYHLGMTQGGQPRRPLYLGYATVPQPWG